MLSLFEVGRLEIDVQGLDSRHFVNYSRGGTKDLELLLFDVWRSTSYADNLEEDRLDGEEVSSKNLDDLLVVSLILDQLLYLPVLEVVLQTVFYSLICVLCPRFEH